MSKKADAVVTTHVGFTGTSKVFMTKRQFRMIGERLSSIEGHVVLHHGDCVNADAGGALYGAISRRGCGDSPT